MSYMWYNFNKKVVILMFNLFKNKQKYDLSYDSNNSTFKILDFKSLLDLKDKKLNTILNYVCDEPIFFAESKRLLSKDEIENFEEQCECKINDYIPLIDTHDNDFIVYDSINNVFGVFNIVDEIFFEKDIEKIIEELKIFSENKGCEKND